MNIELIPLAKHWAREIESEGNRSLRESCINFDVVAAYLEEAVDAHLALYARTEASAPWIAYLARTPGREFVGICSFKDQCRGGRVEIAYFTFPPYEGRGYGRAMAGSLVNLALAHPDVDRNRRAHACGRECLDANSGRTEFPSRRRDRGSARRTCLALVSSSERAKEGGRGDHADTQGGCEYDDGTPLGLTHEHGSS